ncbi:MAG: Gfo/Idh/MocA family oxidoreductase [Candidatus Hydrogenedentes bacterium]|nr:Gfo/Idh/MocA family oxidoreductase [Candidatus Hydrogenedentota bacterium]
MAQHDPTCFSRRAFIATSALATLVSTQSGSHAAPPLRAGLIGGGTGGRLVMEAIAARTIGPPPLVATARDWPALVQRDDLDAIFIATPDHLHAEMAAAALHAGKHVYVLPPFTRTGEEARRLAALACERERVLHVGMAPGEVLRWTLAKDARARTGAPLWIQANAIRVESHEDKPWQRDRTRTHGPAARRIFNMLYPLHHHLAWEAPERATALGGVFHGDPESTPDRVLMTLRYGNGATVVLECGDRPKGPSLMRGLLDQIELPPATDEANLAEDLTRFAAAIAGEREESSARLRAACIAQEAVSGAMDYWARWSSGETGQPV